ncbi:MAG: hypothetical protein Sylvanvirus4_41 [Sylvanvirus sp.]|uniref:Uncharacterized protein n=1 Tax=Sylvanvirus sp. TaxID=2487774 RepID=A0A3G5AHF5_9VIRU|nr:MAG: hypothetical protein Sylvanvirus4_41 [Sylvanvirus sp.]
MSSISDFSIQVVGIKAQLVSALASVTRLESQLEDISKQENKEPILLDVQYKSDGYEAEFSEGVSLVFRSLLSIGTHSSRMISRSGQEYDVSAPTKKELIQKIYPLLELTESIRDKSSYNEYSLKIEIFYGTTLDDFRKRVFDDGRSPCIREIKIKTNQSKV